MTIKERTSSILKRLEEGTEEIYSRYRNLISASQKSYDDKEKEVESTYRSDANAASAQARIDLNNTLETMADRGYEKSGATVQARLSANATKLGALSRLASAKIKSLGELQRSKAEAETNFQNQADEEVSKLKDEAYAEIRTAEAEETKRLEEEKIRAEEEKKEAEKRAAEQEKLEYERAEKSRQQEFENRLALEKLNLEKEKAAASRTTSAAKEDVKKDEGIVPKKSVYEYVDAVVKQNTKTKVQYGRKYTYVDKTAVMKTLGAIVQDENLSRSYRYEMYLYAKSLGYTAN